MNFKAYVAEFIGTFALIFVGVGAIAADFVSGGSSGLVGVALSGSTGSDRWPVACWRRWSIITVWNRNDTGRPRKDAARATSDGSRLVDRGSGVVRREDDARRAPASFALDPASHGVERPQGPLPEHLA